MDCELREPSTLEEALDILSHHGKDAMPIAGGQSLLVMLRNGLISPKILVSLENLAELSGIQKASGGGLSVGAMVSCASLMASPEITETARILAQAAAKVASTPIRNLGTIGGNISHNELGADLPPPLLALNAVAECKSLKGTRRIPLGDFFRDYFSTALDEGEIVFRIHLPAPPPRARAVYLKHSRRAEDLAMVGVGLFLIRDEGQRVSDLRIALAGVAPVPYRARQAESLLQGKTDLTRELIEEIADAAAGEADPITDAEASAEYRRKMIRVFVRRAILQALES
ncbi:MAG: xanthine dehydrogenase family protein subunit M [Deltaproteobacteria bacterium]|nr:xanthine dehydrogenase family protein subunit M [Deltaproteobacteria bacterium]